MRSAIYVCGIGLMLGLSAGCDSSDPAQVEGQTLTIDVIAVNAQTITYNVWNMIEDSNGDNVADDGKTYVWCEGPSAQGLSAVSVPWTFSAKVDLIPVGSTERVAISSTAATEATANVAQYDNQAGLIGPTPAKIPVTVGTRTFKFFNPRLQRSVNRDVMFGTTNPLAQLQGNKFGTTCSAGATGQTRCGLCTRQNPGIPRIDGVDTAGTVTCRTEFPDQCQLPYTMAIEKGDTLVFQGRINNVAAPNLGLGVVTVPPTGLSATVTVDGRKVSLQGTSEGAALSFSYTSR